MHTNCVSILYTVQMYNSHKYEFIFRLVYVTIIKS